LKLLAPLLRPDRNGPNYGGFGDPGATGLKKVFIFTAKGTYLRGFTSFQPFCVKIGWDVWPRDWLRENKESQRSHISRITPRRPHWPDRYQIWCGDRLLGRN